MASSAVPAPARADKAPAVPEPPPAERWDWEPMEGEGRQDDIIWGGERRG